MRSRSKIAYYDSCDASLKHRSGDSDPSQRTSIRVGSGPCLPHQACGTCWPQLCYLYHPDEVAFLRVAMIVTSSSSLPVAKAKSQPLTSSIVESEVKI